MRVLLCCFSLLFAFNIANVANCDILYVEATDGDLGPPETPTDLGSAGLGLNSVTGLLDNLTDFDPDAFMFTVDAGMQLDSISFTSISGSGNHFFAFNNAPLSVFNGAGNLISTLIDNSAVGTNLLDGTINTFGSGLGLGSGPLGPGNYYVWFQETDGSNHDYSISITTSIPEPTSGVVWLALTLGSIGLRRRN